MRWSTCLAVAVAAVLLLGTSAAAQVADCPGDLSGDGKVGQDDLDIVLAAWGTYPPGPCDQPNVDCADLSGDGFASAFDLDIIMDNWGCGFDVAIPEPATLSLLALGALAIFRRKPAAR